MTLVALRPNPEWESFPNNKSQIPKKHQNKSQITTQSNKNGAFINSKGSFFSFVVSWILVLDFSFLIFVSGNLVLQIDSCNLHILIPNS